MDLMARRRAMMAQVKGNLNAPLYALPNPYHMKGWEGYINTGIIITEDMSFTALADFEDIVYTSSINKILSISNEAYLRQFETRSLRYVFGGREKTMSPFTGRIRVACTHTIGSSTSTIKIWHDGTTESYEVTQTKAWFDGTTPVSLSIYRGIAECDVNDFAFYDYVKSNSDIASYLTTGIR